MLPNVEMTEEAFKYDVFLSHSSNDKQVVRHLAEKLRADGLHIWFDEWEVKPGDLIMNRIEEGLRTSRVMVLAMSRHAFESGWTELESGTFRFRDPANKQRRFIPLRLDDSEIKDTLRQFAYVDWREQSDEEYARLLVGCRPAKTIAEKSSESPGQARPVAVLTGHDCAPCGVAITADGRLAVSGSWDFTVRVWNLEADALAHTMVGHLTYVNGVAITADGQLAVSGSHDDTLGIWDVQSGTLITRIPENAPIAFSKPVLGVAVDANGERAVSFSADKLLRVWDLRSRQLVAILDDHRGNIHAVSVSADGRRAISGSGDHTIKVWDLEANRLIGTLSGHDAAVGGVGISADGRRAVSGSGDKTVKVWDLETYSLMATLGGHNANVGAVGISADGRRAISGSDDKTVRVWDLDAHKLIVILEGHTSAVNGVAISANGERAISCSTDHTLRLWRLSLLIGAPSQVADTTLYTNAKVLLVGESGVGKTGLAYRLIEDCFKESISTDAAWATQLRLPHSATRSGLEREIWLWDFAGQADYRLIHQLYMDETALAVLVFNPQSENPFEGLSQWDRDLQRAARRPFRKLLVAGRCDRGGLMISRQSIEHFRQERGFDEYVETSALQGTGCRKLRKAIIDTIQWDDIPWTASPRIFRLLKKEIIKLKDEGKVLLRMAELKQQLEMRLPTDGFALEQLRAVVGLLAGPGVVWQLEFGDFVLLQPERINSYAAAVIRSVRAHTEEIGCIAEEDILAGRLDYQDMKRLPPDEEQIVLRAMHQTFVDHGLCLREHTDEGTLLIFPSYFRRERPQLEGHPLVVVTYRFNGPLDEIYATLVVRLHHTAAFDRDHMWRYAADFKTPTGKRLGLKMTKKGEGVAELEVYFEPGISNEAQVTFIRYVHEHLKLKAQDVVRLRHYVCPKCGAPIENRRAIETRLEKGLKDIVCSVCEDRVELWDLIEEKFASEQFQHRVRQLEEQAKAAIDNESRELAAEAHVMFIVAEAGQIWRRTAEPDWGIDGEIEFRDHLGNASGKRLYVQLKSGDSYLRKRQDDGTEIFRIRNVRHADYWVEQAYPVMLVIRTSDGTVRWMNVSDCLRKQGPKSRRVVFEGEPLTALNLQKLRHRFLGTRQM